jgi:hypothetical protein
MFLNLIFVPLEKVESEFLKIKVESQKINCVDIGEYVNYFEKNFIIGIKSSPRYDKRFWNCHFRILNNLPRTINNLEA